MACGITADVAGQYGAGEGVSGRSGRRRRETDWMCLHNDDIMICTGHRVLFRRSNKVGRDRRDV